MVSSLPTSVQAGPGPGLETSEPTTISNFVDGSIYQAQIHKNHASHRNRLISVLMNAHDHTGFHDWDWSESVVGRIARRLDGCCKFPLLTRSEDDRSLRLREMRCKARLCPLCARARTFDIKEHLINIVDSMDSLRMVTITPLSNNLPLREQLKKLTQDFRKLRRRPLWKRHIKGGVWVLELTFNSGTRQWHPHIHALVDGNYLKQSNLADAWYQVTGDSRIVDIRMKHSKRQAVAYVCKYAAKGSDTKNLPNAVLAEYAEAMNGQRLMQTFGSSHAIKKPKIDLPDLLETEPVNEFDEVMFEAGLGNADALILYELAVGIAERCQVAKTDERLDNLAILSKSVLKKMKDFVNPPTEHPPGRSSRKKPPDQEQFGFQKYRIVRH